MADNNSTGLTDLTANDDGTTQPAAFTDSGQLSTAVVQLYIRYALIGIAIFGIGSNAVVLCALIVHRAQESKKRDIYLLIINQNLLDLCCCVIMLISMSVKVTTIYLTGALGYIVCAIFTNNSLLLCLLNASVINLMALTVERYLKVVHSFWSKKHLKSWMIYAAIVFSWIAGILSVFPIGMTTSFVAQGSCMGFALYWANTGLNMGVGTWSTVSFFILPMIIFIYCYGRIVVVMRKQMRVMAGHNVQSSAHNASQAQSQRVKWNIIKTMIIVSAFFSCCWLPWNMHLLLFKAVDLGNTVGYTVMFLPYVNIALNPFIYATKYEGVRRILARMMKCRKRDGVGGVNGGPT